MSSKGAIGRQFPPTSKLINVMATWKGNAMDKAVRSASRKAARRLIPFLILCFFVAYLDRVNVGFAALTMNKELGLTAEMYGLVADIFFFGYFIFEVPSNLILERVGARRWIARIMISWGAISVSFAFVASISAGLQSLVLHFSIMLAPFI
jgi:sugar phosphate permease